MLFLFSAFSFVYTDEIPEDKKKISYSFEITNTDAFQDYVILAYPVNISSGVPMITYYEMKQGRPLDLPCKFGPEPRIYAIKKELYNPEYFKVNDDDFGKKLDSLFALNRDLIPSSGISCTGYADKNARYDGIKDQLKIESVKPDTMIISLEKTLFIDRKGKVIDESKGEINKPENEKSKYLYYSIPFISLVFIVTLVVIRKMKK